uniref:hypothetical protein n=1 Tax=Enterocloster clostridioformis TaxID=1531 RepID=UPI0030792D86
MQVSTFYEKLNKVDGNIYVVEEEIHLTNGVYEAELQHDNINEATFAVFTGPKLTGTRLETYTLSTPSLAPWKRIVRVYADVPVAYISYETDGDTVEGDDINRVQAAVVEMQKALNTEEARALSAEMELNGRIDTEVKRAEDAELTLRNDLTAEVTRAKAAEKSIGDAVNTEKSRATAAEEAIRNTIGINKPNWDDKYTRNEVDNKFSALETAVDWKEAVSTYADLATTYPHPDDGWTVNVKDTNYTYRWSGTAWIAISANAIPKATQSVDGLLSKEDKTRYDDTYSKRHAHGNKSTLDKLTETLLTNWSDAYNKRHEHGNKTVLDKITQTMLDKLAGIAEGANKYVHPTTSGNKHIPSGGTSGQILRWSADGTAAWGADNNTIYSDMKGATASAAGVHGLVPAPAAGKQEQFLRGDGVWAAPPSASYTHPSSGVSAGTYRSVTVNAQGHVTAGTNPTTLAGYGITDAAAKNHNHDITYLKKGAVTWNDLKGV